MVVNDKLIILRTDMLTNNNKTIGVSAEYRLHHINKAELIKSIGKNPNNTVNNNTRQVICDFNEDIVNKN